MHQRTLTVALLGACACSSSGTTQPDGGVVMDQCPAPSGSGTDHSGFLPADQTWTAASGPHRITSDLTIPQGLTLTIEACAVVQLAKDVQINVNGKLAAMGTSGHQVRFEAIDAAQPWAQIQATRTVVRPGIELHHTRLSGGGKVSANDVEVAHLIYVRGDSGGPMLLVDHVEISGSVTSGIGLFDEATFAPGSTALKISGSGGAPVVMNGYALTNLPDGDYSGNTIDRILIDNARLGRNDQTLEIVAHNRGTPYRLGIFGNTKVWYLGAPVGSAITTLRIEPGVRLLMAKDFSIYVASVNDAASAAIIAQGTASAPIELGSDAATPMAGDWRGILFGAPPTADTILDHVVFRYCGSLVTETNGFSCGTEPATDKGGIVGALMFASNRPITRQILVNSAIEDSASNGIDRGWTGDPVDYLPTNTFTRVAYCTQTLPRPSMGQCPDPAPCPR